LAQKSNKTDGNFLGPLSAACFPYPDRMKTDPHVALLIETSNTYCRSLLQGVAAYVRENRPWSLYLEERERGAPIPGWLTQWDGDGIIVRAENEAIATAIFKTGLPAVNVSASDFGEKMPVVVTNEDTMARLAFEHLRERGFQEFAFCGSLDYFSTLRRIQIFEQLVQEKGYSCHLYEVPSPEAPRESWEQEQAKVAEWLQDLPKPIGLVTPNDFRGQQVLEACRRASIPVPEEVAVVAYGDDEVLCNLTSPFLSSVTTNSYGIGYKAASMLDRLMLDQPIEQRVELVEPFKVHHRQSTDVTAVDDPNVVVALQMIRRQACDGLKVGEILKEIPLSRRQLELRFKKLVGHTLHEEILRVKFMYAQRLVAQSEMALGTIAHRAGFAHASHMGEVFQNKLGVSPSEYRAQFDKATSLL